MNNIYDPWNLTHSININENRQYIFLGPRKIISSKKNNSHVQNAIVILYYHVA